MAVNVDIVGVDRTPRGVALMMLTIACSQLSAAPLAGKGYSI